jgi:hypothetical protein
MRLASPFAALAAALLGTACVSSSDAPDPQAEFQASFELLASQAGASGTNRCQALGLFRELGDDALHSGFTVGVEGVGVLGALAGFGGYDIVWDLYHQELTVSMYGGPGVATPGAGASVSFYAGIGLGFAHGVSDWDGYFLTATADVGIPLLKKLVHLEASGFVSAVRDPQGSLRPLAPPAGVYGLTFGVSVGVGIDLVPTPVSGNLTVGLWVPHKGAIRRVHDELRAHRIFGIRPLVARLVDHETRAPCHADWPAVDGERDCVVALGKRDATPAQRSLHVAYSICALSGGCLVPLAFQMATAALAIGTIRAHGHDAASDCTP